MADSGVADKVRPRHDEVLDNMGLRGRQFIEKYENQVVEMKRSFLDFMKATRDRAGDTEAGAGADAGVPGRDADSEPVIADSATEIKITADGFPIIPSVVEHRNLSKKECENLLRAYLKQHYCKCISVRYSATPHSEQT